MRALAPLLSLALLAACSDDGGGSLPTLPTGDGSSGGPADPSTSTDPTSPTTTGAPTSSTTTDPGGTMSGTATSDATTGTTGTGTSDTTGDDGTTGAPACPGGGLGPGNHDVTIEHDGATRTAVVHVPPGYDPQTPTPLVLNLHGFTSNAGQQVFFSGMNPTADAEGFIVAYGNGLDSSWNAGACCGNAMTDQVDDVGFLRALVEHLKTELCIDPARVYSTGMSNGGFMSHRLACEASDVFAAVGPVSASNGTDPCEPGRPVPVLMFNGTADTLVAYGGGLFQSVQDTFYEWADRNDCVGQPVVTKQVGLTTCQTFDSCADGVLVTQCTHEGMGHCWPGQPVCPFGASSLDLVANEELWAFFSQFTLP